MVFWHMIPFGPVNIYQFLEEPAASIFRAEESSLKMEM
jgi:hypothetical protein